MIFRQFYRDDIFGICELINCELSYSISVDDLSLRIKQMQDDRHYYIFVAEIIMKLLRLSGCTQVLHLNIQGQ